MRSFLCLHTVLIPAMVLAVSVLCVNARAAETEAMTPLLMGVQEGPVPFRGSDGKVHLVYELWMTNFSSSEISIEKVEVLSDENPIQVLDASAAAGRLQRAGQRESSGKLGPGQRGLLFLNVILPDGMPTPTQLSHRVTLHANAAPPGHQEIREAGGLVAVEHRKVVVLGPPLRGQGYISADSCCDAVRHTRAALPVNGRVWLAQRFAVDWEQLDTRGRIYSGPRDKLASYAIFGKPVLAVADARVVAVTDGLPEQVPGSYPTNIALDQADGNSVILDLGNGSYALYAHLQPGSIRVHRGESVKIGQLLGLVGDSGNSVAPHLHFQVMDRPSSLASNGLPYEMNHFQVLGKTMGTHAFDQAEANGTRLAVLPVAFGKAGRPAFPLDQLIISFPEQ